MEGEQPVSPLNGCAMRCSFCATGQMGFKRHLSAEEIFEQAQRFSVSYSKKEISNIVLMGARPFHNYDSVLHAIELLRTRLRSVLEKITLSTVGIVPKIRQFAKEGVQVGLAMSLHST